MEEKCSLTWPDETVAREAFASGDGEGVKIAIIDSGISLDHPNMRGLSLEDDVAVEARDGKIVVEDTRAEDLNGHGTAIAWLAHQIAPRARIGNFRVLNAQVGSTKERICEGVRAAIGRGYHILNCSFGHRDDDGKAVMVYKKWMDEAYLKRVHVVGACNNDNCEHQEWPGFFATCINVNMARGPSGTCYYRPDLLVEFAAAGHGVSVPTLDGGYKTLDGSSYAAPQVAGFLARLIGKMPHLNVLQAKALLQHLSQPWSANLASGNVITR